MVIFKQEDEIRKYLKNSNVRKGFIPTMGALHPGHTSLIGRAKAEGLLSICSIFVNPTQFNDPEDYQKYPVSIDADIDLLLQSGCDVLFLPDVETVYPGGAAAATIYDFGYLETVFEGAQRPGHFKGVGQVVARLLEMVQPDVLLLGQKDFQQCKIIGKLIELLGLNDKIELRICPTVREDDGLAMSSRNRRLSESQRSVAGLLYQCLVSVQSKCRISSFSVVQKQCLDLLRDKGFSPEYIALADADTLEAIDDYDMNRRMVALIAAKIGRIRLIDNLLLP